MFRHSIGCEWAGVLNVIELRDFKDLSIQLLLDKEMF